MQENFISFNRNNKVENIIFISAGRSKAEEEEGDGAAEAAERSWPRDEAREAGLLRLRRRVGRRAYWRRERTGDIDRRSVTVEERWRKRLTLRAEVEGDG